MPPKLMLTKRLPKGLMKCHSGPELIRESLMLPLIKVHDVEPRAAGVLHTA